MTSRHRLALRWSIPALGALIFGTVTRAADPFDGVKPFQAVGTIDPASLALHVTCPDGGEGTAMKGSLKGGDIGTGTFTLCLELPVGPHQPYAPGSLTFTQEDGVSTFTLSLSVTRTANHEARPNYLGTYEVSMASPPLGKFAGRVSGGSGILELSRQSYLLVLNGLLRISAT
jgi:hypothetical protein